MPNCFFLLAKEFEASMRKEEAETLLNKLKEVYSRFWVEFGIVPSNGDAFSLDGVVDYHVVGRVLQIKDDQCYLNITIDSYVYTLGE